MYCQCLPLFDPRENACDTKWEAVLLSHVHILPKQHHGKKKKKRKRLNIKLKTFHRLKNLKYRLLFVGFYQSLQPSFHNCFWYCWSPGSFSIGDFPFLQVSYSFGEVLFCLCFSSHCLITALVLCSALSLQFWELTFGLTVPLGVLVGKHNLEIHLHMVELLIHTSLLMWILFYCLGLLFWSLFAREKESDDGFARGSTLAKLQESVCFHSAHPFEELSTICTADGPSPRHWEDEEDVCTSVLPDSHPVHHETSQPRQGLTNSPWQQQVLCCYMWKNGMTRELCSS